MSAKYYLLFLLTMSLLVQEASGQQTVFSLLRKDVALADKYFSEKNFQGALKLYLNSAEKDKASTHIRMQVARCYYRLKQYNNAIKAYTRNIQDLSLMDQYFLAEAFAASGNYEEAIKQYKACLSMDPGNHLVIKKIWRLENIRFLYDDSLHYAVKPLDVNSTFGELCAVPYQNGIVFMSNRKEVQVIDKIDASSNAPFYRLYHSEVVPDTITYTGVFQYGHPAGFAKEINSGFHMGPVAFYANSKKMVFAMSGATAGSDGHRSLRLYFAEVAGSEWKTSMEFPYNSAAHSITEPAISADGKLLIFSSNMKGGFGGKDLYRSEFKDGKWTVPVNLGEQINTVYDETFPYLHHDDMLYFSSNGHAGMGGLDIYRTSLNSIDEVQNIGYPLNSTQDDFGIMIDSINTHGFLSSNRRHGGFDDDIFEFDIDLQHYPLAINGVMQYKEHNWSDSSEIRAFSHAKVQLIDNIRDITVQECHADEMGNFTIIVPYFSKYKIRVVGQENDEHVVSFEIPRTRVTDSRREIVIVKDAFRLPQVVEVK